MFNHHAKIYAFFHETKADCFIIDLKRTKWAFSIRDCPTSLIISPPPNLLATCSAQELASTGRITTFPMLLYHPHKPAPQKRSETVHYTLNDWKQFKEFPGKGRRRNTCILAETKVQVKGIKTFEATNKTQGRAGAKGH